MTDPRDRQHGTDGVIAAAYDRRAAEYIEVLGAVEQMDARDAAVIAQWRDATPGLLLDAGCGPGHWTEYLTRGGRDAHGIDLSTEFVASARALHPGIRFEVGSFRMLAYESGSVGGILAWYSLIHSPPADLPGIIGEFARVLVRGGRVLVGFFDGEPGEPFAHQVAPAHFWSSEALTDLFADAGLVVSWTERCERAPGEASRRVHGALVARRV